LTNVVRHSGAKTCTVRLGLGDDECGQALLVDVLDDGCGLSADRRPGMGLLSMHVRAAELCGTCVIDSPATRRSGTRVSAVLPLACSDTGSSSRSNR
jgi:signal transduction histidine kinase